MAELHASPIPPPPHPVPLCHHSECAREVLPFSALTLYATNQAVRPGVATRPGQRRRPTRDRPPVIPDPGVHPGYPEPRPAVRSGHIPAGPRPPPDPCLCCRSVPGDRGTPATVPAVWSGGHTGDSESLSLGEQSTETAKLPGRGDARVARSRHRPASSPLRGPRHPPAVRQPAAAGLTV